MGLAILATAYGTNHDLEGADMQPWRLDDVKVRDDVLEGLVGQVLEDLDSEDLQDLDSDVVSSGASLRVADQDVDRKLFFGKIWSKIKSKGKNIWSKIKSKGGNLRNKIKTKLTKLKNKIKSSFIGKI